MATRVIGVDDITFGGFVQKVNAETPAVTGANGKVESVQTSIDPGGPSQPGGFPNPTHHYAIIVVRDAAPSGSAPIVAPVGIEGVSTWSGHGPE